MGIKIDVGKTDQGQEKRDQRLPVGAWENFLGQWVFYVLWGQFHRVLVAALCFAMPQASAGWEGFVLGVWPALVRGVGLHRTSVTLLSVEMFLE